MVKVTVDGIEVDVPPGSNVLQACEAAGKEVQIGRASCRERV